MLINVDFFFGIAVIFVGFAVETLGWKIHKQIVEISGFVVGLIVGDFVFSQVLNLDFLVWRFVILAVSSIGFTILFFVYIRTSIAVMSGIMGALIVSGFTSSRTIAEWSLNYAIFETNYNYPALISAFAVSCYAGYRFYKLGYIVLSTGLGSILVAYGGTISKLWTDSTLGIFLLLSLFLGVIVQLSQEGIIRERREQVKKFRYCTKCGKFIGENSDICSNCGNKISTDE